MDKLPAEWFVDNGGQPRVLDPDIVLAEINRLREIVEEMEDEALRDPIERDHP